MMMNVLLISCYELGHQPLGLASPAAHIRAEGHPVQCLDLSVEDFDDRRVREASFIGISIPMHTAIRLGVKAAERIRRINKTCHICFYGLYASLNGEYLLDAGGDSVMGGEFEQPLVQLIRNLSGKTGTDLNGVWTRSHFSEPFLGRQRFLVPARDLLPPLERYARLDTGSGMKLVGPVEASRGCAHRCLHCPITPVYEGRVRIVQEEVVLADIRNLVEMGAEHITFGDPDFLNGVEHSLRIAVRLHRAFPGITFDMTAKIQHIVEYADRMPRLKDLGCLFIQTAAESINDTILDHLKKEHTRADLETALEITRAAGISLRLSLVAFTPWTTLEDYLELIRFVEERELMDLIDPVQFSIRLLLPPGSSLLKSPAIRPYLGRLNPETFSYEWKGPDPRMDRLEGNVRRIVEGAAAVSEDPWETFSKIKTAALSLQAGAEIPAAPPLSRPRGPRAPRLTESWFCCAEPTEDQWKPITAPSIRI